MAAKKIEALLRDSSKHLKRGNPGEAVRALRELRNLVGAKRDDPSRGEVESAVELAEAVAAAEGADPEREVDAECSSATEAAISALTVYSLHRPSARKIGETAVTGRVLAVLRRTKGETLAARGLRLLGNLARETPVAEKLHEEGAVAVALSFLKTSKSAETLTMAIRTTRILWEVPDAKREMLESGAIEAVVRLLGEQCEALGPTDPPRSEARRSDGAVPKHGRRGLLRGLVEWLAVASADSAVPCAEALRGDGRGFRRLVLLADEFENSAMKCVASLSRLAEFRPDLGSAGAVETLVKKMNRVEERPSPWVRALCSMCGESVNRARVRQCGGLGLLLELFRDVSRASRSSAALHALLHFLFDDKSLKILIREGVVATVADRLGECVGALRRDRGDGPFSDCSDCRDGFRGGDGPSTKKRSEWSGAETDSSGGGDDLLSRRSNARRRKRKKRNADESSDGTVDRESAVDVRMPVDDSDRCMYLINSLSPETSNASRRTSRAGSDEPPSPAMSSSSGTNRDYESDDSEKSASYSPVCYDSDGVNDDREDVVRTEDAEPPDIADETEDESISVENSVTDEITDNADCRSTNHTIQCLLVLLSKISCSEVWKTECVPSPVLLDLLISYVYLTGKSTGRAARIIHRFISLPTNILSILQKPFIFKLNGFKTKSRYKKCVRCKRISNLSAKYLTEIRGIAESDYGIGVISRQFLIAEFNVQQNLALILPLIVSSERVLRRYFILCNGLNVLFSVLANEEDEIENCANALTHLAKSLFIKNPITLENKFEDHTIIPYDPFVNGLDPDNIVIFFLDDSTKVSANREFLCEQSDVFRAMLAGQFKESTEECVTLKNASKDGLEYLFLLLHYGANDNKSMIEIFPLPNKLQTAFDTLLLADRFLMENLKNSLVSGIIQFKMNFLTADLMYIWSLGDGMGILCVESTAFILTGKMNNGDRAKIFSKIMKTNYKQQWLDDIQSMIERHFRIT